MITIKAYDIAVFNISLLLAMNIFIASGFLDAPGCKATNSCDINIEYGDQLRILNTTINDIAPSAEEELSYREVVASAFGLLLRSLVAIIAIFAYVTILLPLFLSQLTLPATVNFAITMIAWGSYVVGYAQFSARSTFQGTE